MRNYLKIFGVYILFSCLSISCALGPKRASEILDQKPKKIEPKEPIDFHLKGETGESYEHKYYVMSVTRTYEDESIAREKEEITDFRVRQKLKKKKEGELHYVVEVLEKNGVMDLHDLVMPYIGEKLEITLSDKSKVLGVEGYEDKSAFYLSPVSLPEEPVNVGDTWALTEEWVNDDSGLPMRIDMVSILKNVYLHNDRRYADIETSGEIQIPALLKKKIGFESKVIGRILLDIESGNVVWSEIRNYENLEYPNIHIEVKSCMKIKAVKPKNAIWPWAKEPECNPREDFVYSIPGV